MTKSKWYVRLVVILFELLEKRRAEYLVARRLDEEATADLLVIGS